MISYIVPVVWDISSLCWFRCCNLMRIEREVKRGEQRPQLAATTAWDKWSNPSRREQYNVIQCDTMQQALGWSSLGTYSICSMFSEPLPDQDKASKLIHHTAQINLTMCNTRSDDSANVLSLQHPSLQCSQKSVFNMISTLIFLIALHTMTPPMLTCCAHEAKQVHWCILRRCRRQTSNWKITN